uniref:SLC26A/SulP transporter domain-containing protein n=1 Tax=Ditylenchus dipsaci TaxID=166011 RepID=A0A915CL43_9BILA
MSAAKRTSDETKIPIILANDQDTNDPQLNQDRVYTSDSYKKNGRSTYLNQEQFDQTFQFQPPKKFRLNLKRHCHCLQSLCSCFTFFYSFFPILQWLPEYKWRDNLVGDFMSGLTVGVIHVPQGIAYAILTGVEPVYGLYTSFFGVLFYMVFGTSRHVSIGSFAIISLMTGVSCRNIQESIDKEYLEAEIHLQNFTNEVPRLEFEYSELVQAITFASGLIQIFMAILRVEFLASYLSDQLVNGFCTGAAVHVSIFWSGLFDQASSPIFLNLPQTNYLALTISLTAFVFLYIGKDFINPKLRKKLPSPIPFELILVVGSTAISSLVSFESEHNVTVVREVPLGLPVAKLPRLDLLPYVFGDSLEIAFVVVALHLSMCKVFNRKMGTKTDNNMELYALGLMGSLSSFFNTYPISSSIGRSMLNVECGAKHSYQLCSPRCFC